MGAAATGFAEFAAAIRAAIIPSFRARLSVSRSESAFLAASASCRALSLPSGAGFAALGGGFGTGTESASFSRASETTATGFSSYPANGTNDVIKSGASFGTGGGAGSGSSAATRAASGISTGCGSFSKDCSNNELEKSGTSASVTAGASLFSVSRTFATARSFLPNAVPPLFPPDSPLLGVFAVKQVTGVAATSSTSAASGTAAAGFGGTPNALRPDAAAKQPPAFLVSETLLLALLVVGPLDDGDGSRTAFRVSHAGVFAQLRTLSGDTRSISITATAFRAAEAGGARVFAACAEPGDGEFDFSLAGSAAAPRALARVDRVFFRPPDERSSSLFLIAEALGSGDVSATENAPKVFVSAGDASGDFPTRPAGRPLRFAAGKFASPFSLSACASVGFSSGTAFNEDALRFATRFLLRKREGKGQWVITCVLF